VIVAPSRDVVLFECIVGPHRLAPMTAISAASATECHETANPFPDLPAIRGPDAMPQTPRPAEPIARRYPSPRFGDYSRTRFESRVTFGGLDEAEDAEEVPAPPRRFSTLETTSGLPDDSREVDEKEAARRLRELRARGKAARAVLSKTPRLAESLQRDWGKRAQFYERFGITQAQFRHGVPSDTVEVSAEVVEGLTLTSRLDEWGADGEGGRPRGVGEE